MQMSKAITCAAAVLALYAMSPVNAQQQGSSRSSETGVGRRDVSGTWERAPPPRDPNAPPPRGTPGAGLGPAFVGAPPPLKPELMAAYEADLKDRQEAERRGEPIASANAQCLPEGMPGMMIALFPMEVLQTRGQVTIVQEAFSQIRRIYIGE